MQAASNNATNTTLFASVVLVWCDAGVMLVGFCILLKGSLSRRINKIKINQIRQRVCVIMFWAAFPKCTKRLIQMLDCRNCLIVDWGNPPPPNTIHSPSQLQIRIFLTRLNEPSVAWPALYVGIKWQKMYNYVYIFALVAAQRIKVFLAGAPDKWNAVPMRGEILNCDTFWIIICYVNLNVVVS